MLRQSEVSNKDLTKSVTQRLNRTGTSGQSKVTTSVNRGVVTLTGTLNHEMQRRAIVQAASRAVGVRQVIDQMTLTKKKQY
jgi:osmotically-inducible protein OsmY